MSDQFSNDLDRLNKLERMVKVDIQKRTEQEKQNQPTSQVIYILKAL